MKLSAVNNKIVGQELASPVYMASGHILMNKGYVLSEKSISRIKSMGIEFVYIKDENEGIQVEEVLPTQLRLEINRVLSQVFDNALKKGRLEQGAIYDIVFRIIDNINISEKAVMMDNIGKESEDTDLCRHSLNVTILSIILGKSKGYDLKKLENLGVGALLHDIGKLFVQDEAHVKKGYDFVKGIDQFGPTSTICIYEHHENEDGSGYPEGIKGDKIYEFAKIVSICNEYTNLITGQKMQPSEAMEVITAKASLQFDPSIYRDFVKSVYCYPNGMPVKLNNNLEGVVVMQNKDMPSRPVVCVYKDGKPFHTYNLVENPTLFIEGVTL